jgi:uncharacterized membrane protein (DUF485 family)
MRREIKTRTTCMELTHMGKPLEHKYCRSVSSAHKIYLRTKSISIKNQSRPLDKVALKMSTTMAISNTFIKIYFRYVLLIAFVRSNTGVVGSNPTRGMGVCACVYSVFVLFCV